MHPYFFNAHLEVVERDLIESFPLEIGNDVWIGHNVTITKGCRKIGDGAVLGAGAVVTRDVREFTIVGGNPARQIGERFADAVGRAVADSEWWNKEPAALLAHLDALSEPLGINHPLLTEVHE